jgi:hypothetical protein
MTLPEATPGGIDRRGLDAGIRADAGVPHFGFIVSLPLEDRVLPVATYRRTNLTLRQFAPMFGISESAAVAEQSKNWRDSTGHHVVIDADTRLVVAVGKPG